MPTGWSWALFCCHDAISNAMKTALKQCSLPAVLVGNMQSPAFFNRQAPALAPYADNANLIALTKESSDKVPSRILPIVCTVDQCLRSTWRTSECSKPCMAMHSDHSASREFAVDARGFRIPRDRVDAGLGCGWQKRPRP